MKTVTTEFLRKNNLILPIDHHFAHSIEKLSNSSNPILSLAAALISNHTGKGHICLDLGLLEQGRHYDESGDEWTYPSVSEWTQHLAGNPVIGKPGEYKPIIFDEKKLYLYRYWEYESLLIREIGKKTEAVSEIADETKLKNGINRLFPKTNETDWQKVAACSALLNRFAVISGGPGTGKTTTVVKILALFLEQNPGLRILLAAPTGKAAARIQQAIAGAKERLDCDPEVKERIPETARTIHRLLKKIPDSPYFFHDRKNPIEADVLVVDEASMIDLPLMAKLFDALPEQCRVLLIGDMNQLASVEVGAVFGDICGGKGNYRYSRSFCGKIRLLTGEVLEERAEGEGAAIQDNIVHLQRNYRSGDKSGIVTVNRAIIGKNAKAVFEVLEENSASDIAFLKMPSLSASNKMVVEKVLEGYAGLFNSSSREEAFSVFESFRILTPLRKGATGVESLNRLVESVLRDKGLIPHDGVWYHGRPVIITKNDYSLSLFNGDTGIAFEEPENEVSRKQSKSIRVYFQGQDGSWRKFLPQRLPEHETAYCLTVHRSQGSEFDRVLFVLPETYTPILTHEVLYTGISRAKQHVEIWGNRKVFEEGVVASMERSSGLKDAFWG